VNLGPPAFAGERHGKLVLVDRPDKDNKPSVWLCRCDCGGETTTRIGLLRSGHVKSCGCRASRWMKERNTTHGLSHLPEFTVWQGIKARTVGVSAAKTAYYGARGITMCERWRNSFPAFLEDMGRRPPGINGSDGRAAYSVERIDNNKGYEPSNCRWATRAEQNRNTSRTIRVVVDGQVVPLIDLLERLGVPEPTFASQRKRLGMEGALLRNGVIGRQAVG
jgi:hypothetical protein